MSMSNEEIIDYLGYIRCNIQSSQYACVEKKMQALLEAVDLIDGIDKCKSDFVEIIADFKKHELDKHTEGVCDGLQMALDIMGKHFK